MIKICNIEGCENPQLCKGLCSKHYQSQRYHDEELRLCKPVCKIEGCGKAAHSKGICINHYMKQWRSKGKEDARSEEKESAM